MIKQNKWKFILSSAAILLPVLVGILLWNYLPEQLPTHWGPNGAPDHYSSRAFAVFALPAFLLAVHWLGLFVTSKDPKNKDQNRKVFGLVWWICPVISAFVGSISYTDALGVSLPVGTIAFVLIGILFVFVGNYMPKCKQNYTIGIKITWTLNDEENWNATHRIAGKTWVIGGILCILFAFLPTSWQWIAFLILIPLVVLIPLIYSYQYHKKHSA